MPPVTDAAASDAAVKALRDAGVQSQVLSPQDLADPKAFNADRFSLLVLPDARAFPAAAQTNLLTFLHQHGRLLCAGGPAFHTYLFKQGSTWQTREQSLQAAPDTGQLVNLNDADPNLWVRSAGSPGETSTAAVEPGEQPSLHVRVQGYRDWANIALPAFAKSPFPAGSTLTTFFARGDAATTAMEMEWRESDGSRWITAVPLTTAWKHYVLTPEDFRFWPDQSPPNRGGPGDMFHPDRANRLIIGLAQSHSPMPPGPKQFWIAGLSSAAMPGGLIEVDPPVLEGLTPWFKVYTDAAGVHPIRRYRGLGLTGDRPGVLEEAPDRLSWRYLSLTGDTTGAAWGGISRFDPDQSEDRSRLGHLASQMLQGIYVPRFGTEQFSYQPGETPVFGAEVINAGDQPQRVVAAYFLNPPIGVSLDERSSHSFDVTLQPGQTKEDQFRLPVTTPGFKSITVLFERGGPMQDRLVQPFTIISPQQAGRQAMVQVKGGSFVLEGRVWHPVGINYWPLYVSGQDAGAYDEGWLAPNQYDPDLVEKDLALCERLHINEVSIQYNRPEWATCLRDFLARCLAHGIRANIYIPGANALSHDLQQVQALLHAADLAHNPAVFAYDIAWEPRVGNHAERKRLDADWQDWIDAQYGAVEAAEAEWQFALPREQGGVTNPLDSQLSNDGPWRRMVAAYRRFVDDAINRGYREAANAIHAVDPNHLLGVRSGYGGNGNPWAAPEMPYDLLSGAKHLDFISPEGYALNGGWPQMREGGFTTAYARWAGDGKPVFWAEFGQSVYPNTTPARIQEQGAYYDGMFRMALDSGANGLAGWWWPGGLRVDENSDFGVISPGGDPRPAALRIRSAAPALNAVGAPSTPGAWITVDRDSDARGYTALWLNDRQQYVKLREAGKQVGVRTAGTGTDTRNVPLTAVGNLPATGHDPLEFVNAEVVQAGTASSSAPVLRVTFGNTGEAAWASTGPGRVALLVTGPSGPPKVVPLPRPVPRYQNVTFTISNPAGGHVTLRLAILGRALPGQTNPVPIPFGEAAENPA